MKTRMAASPWHGRSLGPPVRSARDRSTRLRRSSRPTPSFRALVGRKGDRGLGREESKRERFLQVEPHRGVCVAQVADRGVLSNAELEIAAACRQHEGAADGGGPYDLVVD